MSSWRVSQHYGFGAARIRILPEAHRAARASFREGLADVRAEFVVGGSRAMLRRLVGQSPAILLGLLLTSTFFVTLMRDHSDQSAIEVVLLESIPLEPELPDALPEPFPEPEPVEIAQVEPEPLPVERVVPPPPPPKPPEALVLKPPPKARPLPLKPPAMPQVAKLERPKPPAPRAERTPRPTRAEIAKPRVRMDALSPPSTRPAVEPARTQRVAVAKQNRILSSPPRLSAPAAPTVDLPKDAPRPERFRVAAAPNAARRPIAVASLAAPAQTERPTPSAPRARATRRATARPERVAPLAVPGMGRAPKESQVVKASVPSRSARRDDRPPPPGARRGASRPAAQMARAPSNLALTPPSTTAARVARTVLPGSVSPQGSGSARPGVAGVPLGDLAVCVSDREEDRLKQAVVAAVTTQKECVSRAGTYRFVETKNLNSFLMWIDRSAGRTVGDRCDELRHALECVQKSGLRAGR